MDYLDRKSEEVKAAFSQIDRMERTMRTAAEHYRPCIGQQRYLKSCEVCQYLHISMRTLQTLRDRREIPFTVVGERTILYPEAGIGQMLIKNYHPAEDPF